MLGLLEYPDKVLAEHFADVGFAVTAVKQSLRDRRIGADVFELRWQHRDSVEIRTKTDMVDTGDLDNVINVVEHVVNRRATVPRIADLPSPQGSKGSLSIVGKLRL